MKINNRAKRILIISFFFPPSAKVGARRFAFLSTFFEKVHPELHILTLKEKYVSPTDYSLSGAGTIHRAGIFPNYFRQTNNILRRIFIRLWRDYLCLVDPYSGWILPALVKGVWVVKVNKIDLIIATCPSTSATVVGFLLGKMTRTKLILDYRDPWSNSRNHRSIITRIINEFFEKLSIKDVSALIFCSQIMKENFLHCLGKYTKATCYVVTNGFRRRDKVRPLSLGRSRKNMIYAGTFYGERKIKPLIRPLRQLLDEGTITTDNFCFHIFGKLKDQDSELIKKYCLDHIIKEHPQVSYEQMIKYLRDADILLLLSASGDKYAIPFKLFDYLSVKRPILAIAAENSSVADMMRQIDCGEFASIDSEISILDNLRSMILRKKEYSHSGAEQYTWAEIGHKYLKIIEDVVS